MKQIIPFVLIGLIVAGAVFFLQDDYEGPLQADLSSDSVQNDWKVTLFLNDFNSENAEIGVKLEHINEETDPESINALEFFTQSEAADFFFQDLELEDFGGEIIHEEECEECTDFEGDIFEATVLVNWSQDGETHSEHFQFQIELED